MSKYKGHTEGPWKLGEFDRKLSVVSSDNIIVANTAYRGARQRESNARLIADAPMLLKQRDNLLNLLKESTEMLDRIMNNKEWGAIEEQICDNREFILEVLQDS